MKQQIVRQQVGQGLDQIGLYRIVIPPGVDTRASLGAPGYLGPNVGSIPEHTKAETNAQRRTSLKTG